MCGLTGILAKDGCRVGLSERSATMTKTLSHRGPDDEGLWADPSRGIALGFRRLAIIDLSAEGHQPMASPSGRYVMVYNGEVYNYLSLRKRLEARGATFRGHSDTEVMLAAFEAWGIRGAVTQFVGMFAIALWDRERGELTLVRDRLGIKPLYYQISRDGVLFASELKAMAVDPTFDRRLDSAAVSSFLKFLYVPAPATIYAGSRKLPPGHILTVSRDHSTVRLESYWSIRDVAGTGLSDQFSGTDEEAVDYLNDLLADAVGLRMLADVPLGALLSGGVDSSLVVSLMQAQSPDPVRTYTIGFDTPSFDEAAHARAVARHLGTHHTELHLTGHDALEVIPGLPVMFDEPHADPSQIPTFLVSQLARRDVTVALSGDGGDELFSGYNRYSYGERLIPRTMRWPRAARTLLSKALCNAPYRLLDSLGAGFAARGDGESPRQLAHQLRKVGHLLAEDTPQDMYDSLLSAWHHPEHLLRIASARLAQPRSDANPNVDLLEMMMAVDQGAYLPDDLLAKVDRASMAVSLEARVPLIDHRVVEYSWRLPRRLKLRDGKGKYILRRILDRYVPAELIERPKMGFSVPIASWLRGPLKSWAEELCSPSRLEADEVFQREPVQRAWDRLTRGDDSVASGLWAVLMFQAWREQWLPPGCVDQAQSVEAA